MKTVTIEVPDDLLTLLQQSRLKERPFSDQVRWALAIQLFQEGVISVGRAAELAGEPRSSFELTLGEMGIPPVRYTLADYEDDLRGLAAAEKRSQAERHRTG